jgi:hypothetical protein
MSSSGPNYPDSGTDDSAVGTVTWTSPGNITADDTSYASATGTSGALTHYLKALDFDFAIAAGSTIDGITVSIMRYSTQEGALRYIYDNTVKLVIGGSVTGNNKAATTTKWPTSEAAASYGGAADKWGLTPTVDNVNGTDFGVVLAANIYGAAGATGYVDYITITVDYTASSGVSGSVTKTMDDLSKSLDGDVLVYGTLTKTFDDHGKSFAGGVEVKGRTRVGY